MSDVKIQVGDVYYGSYGGEVEVVYVSTFDEVVFKFDDGSVSIHDKSDFLDMFTKDTVVRTWLTVSRDVSDGTLFFDANNYDSEKEAIDSYQSHHGMYQLVEVVPVEWVSNVSKDEPHD
jgi:hypothetical protein